MKREELYTARWHVTQALEEKDVATNISEAIKHLQLAQSKEVVDPNTDRPSVSAPAAKQLSYPLADFSVTHKTQGNYPNSYPKGAVVHFTAGQCDSEQDAIGTMNWGKTQGYAFWSIGPTGKVYQTHTLDRWGHHAGTSSWPGLGEGLSNKLLGIEVVCAGKTDNDGKAWFGKVYRGERLRVGPTVDNCQAGTYVKYTEAQEKALIDLLLWLKKNNPEEFSFDHVLGHDSIAPARKNDPGHSLSMTIPELQAKLKSLYQG